MKRAFCVFILISCVNILNAQFINNLFTRYQQNELRKYNDYGRRTSLTRLPLKCSTSNTARDLWEKGEAQLNNHAMQVLQERRLNDEIKVFSLCIRVDSAFCDAYFRLAQCLFERTDWVGVLNLLNLAERKFPNEPLVYIGLGQAQLYLHYSTQALENFERVIALLPNNEEGYLGASMAAYKMGQEIKALEYLRQGCGKMERSTLYLRLFKAILLYDTHETQQAYNLLSYLENFSASGNTKASSAVLKIDPAIKIDSELDRMKEYYVGLCYAAKGEDFYDKAAHHVNRAKKQGLPVDSIARILGLAIAVDNPKGQLLSSYHIERVHDKKKSNPAASEAFENRKIDEATNLFLQSIKEDSLNLYSYIKLAECFQNKNEPQKALSTYELALKKFPKDNLLATRLTRQLIRVDSLSSALEMTMGNISTSPNKEENYYQAALILYLMNRKSDAINLLKKLEPSDARKKRSMSWRISFILGEFYFLSGEFDMALPYLQFAIQDGSHDPYLNYYYAKCLVNFNCWSEAKKYFYDAIELGAIIDKGSVKKFQLIEKQSTPYAEKY